jgi:hypothetical protein
MANQQNEINHTNLHKYLSCEYAFYPPPTGVGREMVIQFKEGVITWGKDDDEDKDRLFEMMEREASLDDFDVSILRNLTWAELVKRDVDWYKNKRVVSGYIRERNGCLYISGYGDYPADLTNFTIEETGIVTMRLKNGLYCRTTDDIQKIMWRVNSLHNDEVFEKVDEYSCIPPIPDDTCKLCDDEECDGQCYVCSEGCGKIFNINEWWAKCADRDMCCECAMLPQHDNCECDICIANREESEEDESEEEKEEEGKCDCCCRDKPCGEIFCDCCGKSWRNDKKSEETCHCECSDCCRLQRDCRYSCDGKESEEESEEESEAVEEAVVEEAVEESEEEEYEAVVQEEWVPYYLPPRNIPSDRVIAILKYFEPQIVKDIKVNENMAECRRMKIVIPNKTDEMITIEIEWREFKIKLMRLAKTIISTLGKIGFNPDIVRMFYTRYTETLVDYDEWMSKNLPEGEYLTSINLENEMRNEWESYCVQCGVLPVPKPDYL